MKTSSSWNPPKSGEVWIGKREQAEGERSLFGEAEGGAKWRRVIFVRDGFVFYSVGADTNRECRLKTFRRWANVVQAAPIAQPVTTE